MTSTITSMRRLAFLLIMTLVTGLASAQSLTTTFTSNNGQTGNMFDIVALNNVLITSFDINFDGTSTIEVWAVTGGGPYLPHTASNANWTLLQTVPNLTSNGADVPTPLPALPSPFLIPAGTTQGFHVTTVNGSINYTNGTTTGSIFVQNADMQILEGHGGPYFALTFNPRVWNGTVYYLTSNLADDVGITAMTAPAGDAPGCDLLSTTETVTVTIRNLGTNAIPPGSLISVDLEVDGLFVTNEGVFTPAMPMNQGDSITHTFGTTVNLSPIGSHTVKVTHYWMPDLDPANDSLTKSFISGGMTRIATFPYVENFDSVTTDNTFIPPAGWTQDALDGTGFGSDWIFRFTPTPSAPTTGPSADHTSGSGTYAFVEDAYAFATVNLRSPCFDLIGLAAPTMNYWIHSNNGTTPTTTGENFFSIDVVAYPGGTVTVDADGPIGHIGPNWSPRSVNLSPWLNQTIQVVFRGSSAGTNNLHDIAIDDVSVFDPQPTPGQPAQAGLALLDIEAATNINTAPVQGGTGGPFYSTVSVGEVMDIRIEGEVLQPIAFLAGPLTPVAATYPNIGQLDIGGAVNPMTGVPAAIVVIADGFTPTNFVNAVFNTGPAGTLNLGFQIPPLPSGVLAAFQSLLATNNGFFFAISNAVEVTVM